MEIIKKIKTQLHAIPNYDALCTNLKGFDAYVAGGFIRNTLLDKPINDLDLFINATMDNLSIYLDSLKNKGNLEYGPFGAPRWFTFNGEFYADIVPFSKFVVNQRAYDTINEILSDFDITINAIAFDINKRRIIDPVNGLNDIKNKTIKAIHFNFPDINITSGELQISSLSVFWFRLLHYKFLLDFNFESNTLEWIKQNKVRYKDLEIFKQVFFNPIIDYSFVNSL